MRTPVAKTVAALTLLGATLAPGSTRAATFTCEINGGPGDFHVRRIVAGEQVGMTLDLGLSDPLLIVAGERNHHTFAGVWLLQASDLDSYSHIFVDAGATLTPGHVGVTVDGGELIDQRVPTTTALDDGYQGHWAIGTHLAAGTYYLVGFGAGNGQWLGAARFNGTHAPICDPVEVPGHVATYDVTDFAGGTHASAMGLGHAENIILRYSNPHGANVIAAYAYQPSPYPETTGRVASERGTMNLRQYIGSMTGMATQWEWTVSYTGKTNTLLIEHLQLGLTPE